MQSQISDRLRTRPTQEQAEDAVRTLIEWAGDDPAREGLLETPGRLARAYRELFSGYDADPRDYLERTFKEVSGYDELVVLRDIRVVSFCEHHMLPFLGRAHIGYLPADRVVGISKLARVVHGFARRLQIQETLTAQIAQAVQDILRPQGVGRRDPVRAQLYDHARGERPRLPAHHLDPAWGGPGRPAHPPGVPGAGSRPLRIPGGLPSRGWSLLGGGRGCRGPGLDGAARVHFRRS